MNGLKIIIDIMGIFLLIILFQNSPTLVGTGFTEKVVNPTGQVDVMVVDGEGFGSDDHGHRITLTYLANTNRGRIVQLTGLATYRYDNQEIRGNNTSGLIHHSLNLGSGIFWSATDDSPSYHTNTVMQWNDEGDRPFFKQVIPAVKWLASQDILFISSLENPTIISEEDQRYIYCDDYPHIYTTDYWIPMCGAIDDYIAHSGMALDRTIFAGGIFPGGIDYDDVALSSVRAKGVFDQNTIYVVSPGGSTSHATAVLAGYATNLAFNNPGWGAAKLKQELMTLATDETLEHGDGANRVVKVIRPANAPIAVALTINDASAEEGDALTFTITLDNTVSGGFSVIPRFTDGTATKGTDYTENTQSIRFTGTANETQTFTVSTTQDEVVESDETFTIRLRVSETMKSINTTDTGIGSISNDDAATVTINDASANEGEMMIFTVTLDHGVDGGLSVTPNFTDGTATEGTDYTENTQSITFMGTAGETQTFTVATIEDDSVESDETFTVGLSVSETSETITSTDTGTGTIVNDDVPLAPSVTISNASANEGEMMTFTVTLDKAVSGGFSVIPSFTDGTATKGTDYTENTQSITFTGTANEIQTFAVATIEDNSVEPDETFTIGLTVSGTSETVTSTDTGTGTIINDDVAVAPSLTVNDASTDEGDAMIFTVTLDKAVSGGFSMTLSFTDGTATEGTDYTENTQSITFTGTANETQTFTVATIEDNSVEPDETFTVGLTVSETSQTITSTDTGIGIIVNDDATSATVSINNASANEGDAITFTVTLDKVVVGGFTVTPSFTDGTASKATDYTENTQSITFTGTANETKTFTVSTMEDDIVEPDETFTIGLTVSGTSQTIISTDTGTGTIVNDDATSATVSINNASANEGDAITFTVTLDKVVIGGFSVTPSFTDGTASKGTDYTENTQSITFTGTANETHTFTVATIEDDIVEPDETFTVSLTVSGTSETITSTDTGTGTIINDDVAVVPSVTINDASANEGEMMIFTITLDRAVAGGFSVTPSFADGTASKGTDYTENTQAILFTGTADETKTFTVATIEDDSVEPDETFTVDLTVSGASETVISTDTGTGTIIDDDVAIAPSVTINDVSVSEGDAMTFTITLDKSVSGGFSVTPNFTDDTASKGTDYTENTQAITFTGTADETKTFTVATIVDELVESDETFQVALNISETTPPVTSTDTATGTILNDDHVTVSISVTPNPVEEGSSITANARISGPLLSDVILPLIFTAKTAETTDYQMLSSITILQNELRGSGTVVTIVDEDSDDEIFTIALGTLPPNTLAGDTTSIDVTIIDQRVTTSTDGEPKITVFALEQNYPNPFNPSTIIEFSLHETQPVTLTVYDMLGQKIETLIDGIQSQGRHQVAFSAPSLPSSKYFYVLQTDQNVAVKVMTLLK